MNNLYGLLGEKLSHSKSPFIHDLILNEINLKGSYYLFEVDENDLVKAFEGFKVLKFKGINVTIPYKIKLLKLLDELSEEAKNIGSINTVKFIDGISIGYNTDYYGFICLLKKYGINVKNKKVVVLGTGGAAKAILHALKDMNAGKIFTVTRNLNIIEFDEDVELINYSMLENINYADILINCTPVGMYPKINECPINKKSILKFGTVIDLIYNPTETLLLKYAKLYKIPNYNGLYMLIAQAVKSQEIWNNVNIEVQLIDRIYEKFTSNV